MANWILTLRVGDDRLAFEKGKIDLKELTARYAKELRRKVDYVRRAWGDDLADDAEDIAHDFEKMVETVEEFDDALERLYNWADTTLDVSWPRKKLCWVEPTSVEKVTS